MDGCCDGSRWSSLRALRRRPPPRPEARTRWRRTARRRRQVRVLRRQRARLRARSPAGFSSSIGLVDTPTGRIAAGSLVTLRFRVTGLAQASVARFSADGATSALSDRRSGPCLRRRQHGITRCDRYPPRRPGRHGLRPSLPRSRGVSAVCPRRPEHPDQRRKDPLPSPPSCGDDRRPHHRESPPPDFVVGTQRCACAPGPCCRSTRRALPRPRALR